MKKFKCEVTKTYEYEIEFDENVWTEEELEEWSRHFSSVDDLQELAELLAEYMTKYDKGEFIEGFGIPMINGEEPYVFGNPKPEIEKSVNVNIVNDEDCYIYSEEI